MLPDPICFIDLETTGASFNYDRVIEVGILRVEKGQVVKTFNTLINPHCSLSPDIELLTGIRSSDLENAPSFYEVKNEILEVLDGATFAAHNARFDYAFLKSEFKRQEITFNARCLCTVKLSRKLFPEFSHHNLSALIERFSFSCENRHRAFDDAKVLWDFCQLIQKQFDRQVIEEAIKKVMKRPSLPAKLKKEDLNNLPELPGVYIFYGENGMPLYVGKSINIRERVLSHFSADIESQKEMNIAQQVESIETLITNGELGALLKESELIKKLQPLYNRVLRYKKRILVLKRKATKGMLDEYSQVELIETDQLTPSDLDDVLAIFKNKRSARQFLVEATKEYDLCEKLLGLEKTSTSCFGYRLGRCNGGCIQKEAPVRYNMRFEMAFAHSKITQWPFNGPIIIRDSKNTESSDLFLVDKWCFAGSLDQTQDLEGMELKEISFDLDTYKILKRHLLSKDHIKNIQELKI